MTLQSDTMHHVGRCLLNKCGRQASLATSRSLSQQSEHTHVSARCRNRRNGHAESLCNLCMCIRTCARAHTDDADLTRQHRSRQVSADCRLGSLHAGMGSTDHRGALCCASLRCQACIICMSPGTVSFPHTQIAQCFWLTTHTLHLYTAPTSVCSDCCDSIFTRRELAYMPHPGHNVQNKHASGRMTPHTQVRKHHTTNWHSTQNEVVHISSMDSRRRSRPPNPECPQYLLMTLSVNTTVWDSTRRALRMVTCTVQHEQHIGCE